MTTSVGIVDSKGSICHAVGILLFLSSSKRLEEHRKPPPTKLPHSTLRSTVIHANIFILTVPFQSHFRHLPANGSRSLSHLKSSTHSALREKSHTTAHTPKHGASLLCSRAGHLTVLHQSKEQPEKADTCLWRVSASSGAAAPLGGDFPLPIR